MRKWEGYRVDKNADLNPGEYTRRVPRSNQVKGGTRCMRCSLSNSKRKRAMRQEETRIERITRY